jgi:hypothetical protein
MVLRALGEAAHMTVSRFIEFGDKSIAVATGLDHTTTGSHLRALRSKKNPLVTLVEPGRGTKEVPLQTVQSSCISAELDFRGGQVPSGL